MTNGTIEFTVYGTPATAGSKRGFPIRRKDGSLGVAMAPDNLRAKSWMGMVAQAARTRYQGELLTGPVHLKCTFFLARPKSHFGTGKNAGLLKDSAPVRHTQKPDALKMARLIEDVLTGTIVRDDSQICSHSISKEWTTESARAHIVVLPMEQE